MSKRVSNSRIPVIMAMVVGALLVAAAIVLARQGTPAAPAQTSLLEEDTHSEIPRVSLTEAKGALDAGLAVFVDVRSAESYAGSHIAGAVSIPLAELEGRLGELERAEWIITYCT